MKNRVKYAVIGVALVAIFAIAVISMRPSDILTFAGKAFGSATGAGGEYINVQVEVSGGSSWVPSGAMSVFNGGFGTEVSQSFWTVDGVKYTQASATLKVKVSYGGIKIGTLNATTVAMYMSTVSAGVYPSDNNPKSFLVSTQQNGINTATDGVWDRYTSNPFTGSKTLDAIAADLSLPTDGSQVTVYNYYYVEVKGIGEKSGQTLTVTIGPKAPTPASNVWQYYTESASSTQDAGDVTFSSWLADVLPGAFLGSFAIFVAYLAFRRGRR